MLSTFSVHILSVYTDMRGDVRRPCIMGHVRVSDIHQTRSHARRIAVSETDIPIISFSVDCRHRVTALHSTSY